MHRTLLTKYAVLAVTIGCLVGPPTALAASDSWITAKTKVALLTTPGVSSTSINVDTVDGRVTLHGKVASAEEKAKAETEARKISGVKEVRNLLEVVPERREKIVKASDSEVRDRVAKALKNDRSLADSSITVQSVNNGTVLLAGKANSILDHLRAIETARAVPGVKGVESEIQSPDRLADDEIRHERGSPTAGAKRKIGTAASDMFITSATKLRLVANAKTPATDINVDTRNGVVTLFGIVPTKDAKAAADAEARKVSGVKKVMNELQVVPSAKREEVAARDEDLQDAVKKNLKDREDLKDASISVQVKNGVARLTGTVEDEEQRLEAAVAARSTRGIRSVEDDLRLSSR